MHYFVYQKQKQGAKAIKTLFQVLTRLVEGLESQKSAERMETDTKDPPPQTCSSKSVPGFSVLQSVCQVLLRNEMLKNNFLAAHSLHGAVITAHFAKLIGNFPPWLVRDSSDITFFTDRLVVHVTTSDHIDSSVLQALVTFIPIMSDAALLAMLDSLLKHPTTSVDDKEEQDRDELTPSGQRGLEVLSGLVKTKQVLLEHGLSYAAVQAIVDMAVRTGLQSVLDILGNILEIAPIYRYTSAGNDTDAVKIMLRISNLPY